MLNVYTPPTLRRCLSVIGFSILTTLALSVPSFAVYYNLGAFWKTTSSSVTPFMERKITAGGNHGCAVVSDGTVKCWGSNPQGQLGDGTTTQRTTPVTVSGLSGAVLLSAGTDHSCALLSDGTAKCWGLNGNGQLGDGTSTNRTTPVAVSGLTGVISIASGDYFNCATLSDGTAKCWGVNSNGQIGDGTTTERHSPTAVTGISTAVSIAAGISHVCITLVDGTAKCWGVNTYGQLGDGTTTQRTTPVTVTGISTAVSMAGGGGNHSCALLSVGTVKCWGYNIKGQLGNNTTVDSPTPVSVTGISGAVSLGAGFRQTCAVLSDGTVRCWGAGSNSQLGNGASTSSSVPVTVTGLSGAVSIVGATEGDHFCAGVSDGTVKCWGLNTNGQLGNGTTANSSTYVSVTGSTSGPFTVLEDIVSSLEGGESSCALLSDGTAKCWGDNEYGQIGDGIIGDRTTPVTVSGLSGAVSISISGGDPHSCALLSDGTAKCWGYNLNGHLGDGTTTNRATPVAVTGLSGAVSISVGEIHNCALLSDGTGKCWGRNTSGGLGDGTTTDRTVPVTVSGLSGAISIIAGSWSSCALLSNGTAKCWGENASGQLGDGTTTDRYTPVAVSGLSGVASVSSVGSHFCALLSDGTAKCWGNNQFGKLGDGTTTNRTTPVTVSGLSGAISISAGGYQSCAVLSDGSAKCWGSNSYGQLGDGTATNRSTPVTVSGVSGAVSISAGNIHNCVVFSNGTAKCLGYGYSGQLGDGRQGVNSSVPVSVVKEILTASANNGTGATSLVISKPSGTATNHVMIAGITTRPSTTTITTPSGWTLLESQATGNVTQSIYYRVATSADDSVTDYTWILSTSSKASGVVRTYQDVDPTAPIIASDGQATAASAVITAPSLTTTESDFESVVLYGIESDDSIYPPSGYDWGGEDASTGGGGAGRTRTLMTRKRYTTSGATGAILKALGVSARDNVGQHVLLKKAP